MQQRHDSVCQAGTFNLGASSFRFAAFFTLVAWMSILCQPLDAQTEEMRVLEGVKALEQQLSSASFADRDKAEKALIELGTEALDHISDPSRENTDDLNERLVRIRKALEKVAVKEAVMPSRISLSGTMSLKTAFARVKKQTGNVIALAEGYEDLFLEKEITLNLDEVSYWKTLYEITARAGLEVQPYSGMNGQTTLVPKSSVDPVAIDQAMPTSKPIVPFSESGIFQIRVIRVDSTAIPTKPETSYSKLTLEIQWEPRLTPISIDIPLRSVEITDEDGNEIRVSDREGVLTARVQQGINPVELPVVLQKIDRKVQKLKSLKAKLECVVPGRREKFRFGKLSGLDPNHSISRAGVSVEYLGYEANEDLYAVSVRVSMNASETLESHLGWIYDNPLFLINDQGQKLESIGQQGGDIDEDGVTVQYFFIEDPAEMGMLYESPGAIIGVPTEITIKEIPLP